MATVHTFRRPRLNKPTVLLLAVIAIVISVHVWITRLYAFRLHAALGYGSVYSTNMTFELLTQYGGAVLYAVLAWWAVRRYKADFPVMLYPFARLVAGAGGWLIGYAMWMLDPTAWLLFFHHLPFGTRDPLFHLDLSFYVYQLPIWVAVVGRVLGTVLFFLLLPRALVLLLLFARQQTLTQGVRLEDQIRREVSALFRWVSVMFVLFAVLTWLGRYEEMLNTQNGSFIFGPDFVTARLALPVFSWLHIAGLLLVAASMAWLSVHPARVLTASEGFVQISRAGWKRPLQALAVYLATVIATPVIGGLVNTLYVHPNQNTVELPYIADTIAATRWALGIEHLQTQPFVPSNQLTAGDVSKDQTALDNARVTDQRQTASVYNQLQSFKSYFVFDHASVDRYGRSEVYVGARQLNADNLPVQTWVNRTLVYTHGYGLAASPVNQFDRDGLPTLWAKNTPQQTQPPIPAVTRPEIYFGTMGSDVIAPSRQSEFDYPVASSDHTSHYAGGYGLPIRGNRWLLAIEQGTLRFYTSDQITAQSQWLFDRNIYQRVQDIAPFLHYDNDAFPFVDSAGHIQWMLDAYTETSNIPYAQSFLNTSYIRNSVKVVMDAYTGQVHFYVVDKADPMLQSLMQVYPTLFTTQIPADVRAHFRYPSDLFLAQAKGLTRYHMTDASAFYNQEDLWAIANQIYQQNQVSPRPPVYQMIRMPDRTQPDFVLSELFTPATKNNMNGWLIADNSPGHYGQLTLYQFPQSSLTVGPMLAENQIDADPSISAQLTLWNQQGSQVVRGDLLLVPIRNALLFIEPVYLVASRENSLPQLQRVIIDFNQQVYIDTSLANAMQDLLNGQPSTVPQSNVPGAGGASSGKAAGSAASPADLAAQANRWLQQYRDDTAKGNFVGAGTDLKQLGAVLARLALTAKTTSGK